jgi:hypothetical protein
MARLAKAAPKGGPYDPATLGHEDSQLETTQTERESHHCRVVAAKVRKYLKSGCLDRLVPTKTQVDEAEVKPVGVVRVW